MEKETAIFTDKFNSLDENDRKRIITAWYLADDLSIGAASVLVDMGMDADTIAAALILNRYRDNSLSDLNSWSPVTCLLADGVRKIDTVNTHSRTIHEAHNIMNMLFALTDDIRVILIKLAEKLCALRILDSSDDEGKRKTAARECLDIYAPLAGRLGISWIKNEMEDISLKFLNRETYQQIRDIVSGSREHRSRFLETVCAALIAQAQTAGITINVESRAKHFYSIYMKMRKRNKSVNEIFDLSGIRILCGSVENCYTLLGIAHRLYKPIDGCFKDYIARPKPNGYMSLHTSVMAAAGETPEGIAEERMLEIQIRTGEMHEIAENGIASHWLYKKGSSRDMVQDRDIGIVNLLKNWKEEYSEISGAWMEGVKQEILKKSVYVFTPQGKVIKLPSGATPIDFAYHIHTAIGEHCMAAKANGSIIPLNSPLKNTQIIEILTSQSAHPHPNWIQLAKSPKTRNRIRSWLEKNDASFLTEKPVTEKKKAPPDTPAVTADDSNLPVQRVIHPLSSVMRVRIGDEKNMMIRFARCCNPVTGDAITGYVSRGRGIIIHRENCKNLANNPEIEKRKIEADWDSAGSELVKSFRIEAKHSANLFSEIEGAVRKRQGHLIEGRLEETAANRLTGIFTMQLARDDDLKAVIKNIRSMPGIISLQLAQSRL